MAARGRRNLRRPAPNVAVLVFLTGCNIGRAIIEERVLASSAGYAAYRERVHWRLVPGLW